MAPANLLTALALLVGGARADALGTNTLYSDKEPSTMAVGEWLTSRNGLYYAYLEMDGELTILDCAGDIIALGGTGGVGFVSLHVRGDGDIIFQDAFDAYWVAAAPAAGLVAPFRLVLENNGDLVLYDGNHEMAWQSGTGSSFTGVCPKNCDCRARDMVHACGVADEDESANNALAFQPARSSPFDAEISCLEKGCVWSCTITAVTGLSVDVRSKVFRQVQRSELHVGSSLKSVGSGGSWTSAAFYALVAAALVLAVYALRRARAARKAATSEERKPLLLPAEDAAAVTTVVV